MPAEHRKLDVVEREQAIFRYLRGIDRAVGATVRELHEQLTVMGATAQGGGEVRDTVTVQAYHKLVTRLVLDGRLVEVGDPGADAQRYALAPALHADTALTLDDIDQIAFELKPTEAIAALIDAREYVGANRDTVLRRAAIPEPTWRSSATGGSGSARTLSACPRPAAFPAAGRVPSPSPTTRAGSLVSSPCACSATR